VTEKRVERLRAQGHHGTPAEREANDRELAILERLLPGLQEGKPIRDMALDDDESRVLRGFRFLTEKPVLVLLNIGEADLPREAEVVAAVADRYRHERTMVDGLSARVEMEIGELEPEDAAIFMEELGLHESSLDRVIRLSYRLLGLISFFTAGPDETRAWTIPDGASAVDAAGAIHSDLARGFIRAEVVTFEDLVRLGTMAEARKAGRLRAEGKTYRVRDGDVIEVLFNV
jgi:ribosome-binding ATPase